MFFKIAFDLNNRVSALFVLICFKRIYVFFGNIFFHPRSYRLYTGEDSVENSVEIVRNDLILQFRREKYYFII